MSSSTNTGGSNIEMKNKTFSPLFLEGKSVFRIVVVIDGVPKDPGIVTTKEDYDKKLASHDYVAILHLAPLHYKLAYLFGCLNREKGVARKEEFMFMAREIGKHTWVEWFGVGAYVD